MNYSSGQTSYEWVEVRTVVYSVWTKRGAPPGHPRTLRVDYRIGHQQWVSEWVCLEHTGFAKERAIAWWQQRSKAPIPRNIEEAVFVAKNGGLADTKEIAIVREPGGQFPRIVGHRIGPVPDWDASKRLPVTQWMTPAEIEALKLPFEFEIINKEIDE